MEGAVGLGGTEVMDEGSTLYKRTSLSIYAAKSQDCLLHATELKTTDDQRARRAARLSTK